MTILTFVGSKCSKTFYYIDTRHSILFAFLACRLFVIVYGNILLFYQIKRRLLTNLMNNLIFVMNKMQLFAVPHLLAVGLLLYRMYTCIRNKTTNVAHTFLHSL